MSTLMEDGGNETTTETVPLLTSSSDELSQSLLPTRSMPQIIKSLFTQKAFIYWFIFKILYFTQVFAAGLFIPLYAAEWFGNCLEPNGIAPSSNDNNNECIPDYSSYAYYSTMFISIAGIITFLLSSFIGNLSDTFGRKMFFFIAILTWMIPRFVMVFYVNFYLYFALSLFEAINGGDFFIASKGYIADIVQNKNERIIAYGFGQSAVGIGCIFGSIFAVTISTIWNAHSVFIALTFFYILLLVYVFFFISEPNRYANVHFDSLLFRESMFHPFKFLKSVCKHKLIFYVSLLSLFMAIVESGVMSNLFAYIGNEFDLNKEGKSSLIFGIFAVLMSIAVICTGFLLAFFKGHYDEINIMIIAINIKILSLLLLSSISMYPHIFCNYVILYVSAFLYGSSFFIWPSITGLLTKYLDKNEQGTGFGVVDSWTAIANIFAPFSFGYFYVEMNKINLEYVVLLFAIFFCVISILIILLPLKQTIKKQTKVLKLKSQTNTSINSTLPSE